MPGLRALPLAALVALVALGAPDRRAAAQDGSPLLVTLQLDRRLYEPGAAILFSVRIENISSAPVTVLFLTSQRFDVVLRSTLTDVARWSGVMNFTQAISRQTWAAGEAVTFTDAWIPRTELLPALIGAGATVVPRGLFTIQAELTGAMLKPVSRPETIVIGPPVLLEAGCTTLLDTLSADTPIGVMGLVIEPFNALQALWQSSGVIGSSTYLAFAPGIAAVNNLQVVRRNLPLTVCLNTPARITVP